MINLICIVHYHNQQKYSHIKCFSEENKKRSLKVKVLREEVKGEIYHELQCFSIPEIFSDCHGNTLIYAIKSAYEISLVFRHFPKYTCSKFVVFLAQRSSCSQVLAFQLNLCIPGYNSEKHLVTTFFKKNLFFFKILFLNCLMKLYR